MKNQDMMEALEKKRRELHRLIRHSSLTFEPLEADFNHAIEKWRRDHGSQFWSRTVLRCLCAAIEARLFYFRKMAEQMGAVGNVQFDKEEVEILAEQRVVVQNGKPTTRPKWLPFPDAVKESFRLFGKAVGTSATVDYGNSGFAALCKALEIRNRLMHPKGPFDISVSQQEINLADEGINWFNQAWRKVLDDCRDYNQRKIKAILDVEPQP